MARILVIEDDEGVIRYIRQALENVGHQVVAARDGKEGIALYRENPADLVITDIVMPEKDGFAVIMELQREFPKSRLIAISGGYDRIGIESLKMAKKFGAFRSLEKPFSVAQLLDTVSEALA